VKEGFFRWSLMILLDDALRRDNDLLCVFPLSLLHFFEAVDGYLWVECLDKWRFVLIDNQAFLQQIFNLFLVFQLYVLLDRSRSISFQITSIVTYFRWTITLFPLCTIDPHINFLYKAVNNLLQIYVVDVGC